MTRSRPRRWLRALFNVALVVALLSAVSFLPPDTSAGDVQKAGVLKFCVPTSFPPLVTGDESHPGYDVELAKAIAEKLEVRLAVNVVPSIGKDYNPRNWFLTRAQCDIVGGGVADTEQTRSFMQTIPTGIETGWVGISADGALPPSGSAVAVLPGTTGLDRLALSSWMRANGLRGQGVQSPAALVQALQSGTVQTAVAESFAAATFGLESEGYELFWLDDPTLPHFSMALGMWKGDQTLRRSVQSAVEALGAEQFFEKTRFAYGFDAAFGDSEVGFAR